MEKQKGANQMSNQEALDRIAALKQEIAELRKNAQPAPKAYALASQKCDEYFLSVRQKGQHYGAQTICENAARSAIREKKGLKGKEYSRPNRYITTEEDAEEYFELFKRFLSVYQEYRQKE